MFFSLLDRALSSLSHAESIQNNLGLESQISREGAKNTNIKNAVAEGGEA